MALNSLQSTFLSPLSFWQAFLNGNTLLKSNLKIRLLSLPEYFLGMFTVAAVGRGLDTEVLAPTLGLTGLTR